MGSILVFGYTRYWCRSIIGIQKGTIIHNHPNRELLREEHFKLSIPGGPASLPESGVHRCRAETCGKTFATKKLGPLILASKGGLFGVMGDGMGLTGDYSGSYRDERKMLGLRD